MFSFFSVPSDLFSPVTLHSRYLTLHLRYILLNYIIYIYNNIYIYIKLYYIIYIWAFLLLTPLLCYSYSFEKRTIESPIVTREEKRTDTALFSGRSNYLLSLFFFFLREQKFWPRTTFWIFRASPITLYSDRFPVALFATSFTTSPLCPFDFYEAVLARRETRNDDGPTFLAGEILYFWIFCEKISNDLF